MTRMSKMYDGEKIYILFSQIYILIKRDMQLFLYRSTMLRNVGLSRSLNSLMKECLIVKRSICCLFF